MRDGAGTAADVLVIGAGPTGLACAIDAQNAGFDTLLVDKGCLCNSLFHYPSNMTFFTTPELLEIGNIPFSSPNQKPNRQEALEYYRKVAQHFRLKLHQYQHVERVEGEAGDFIVHCMDIAGRPHQYRARALIIATGYYDRANYLNIPGEDLTEGLSLLPGPTSLLRPGCAGDWWQEFRGNFRAGFVAAWRAGDVGPSWSGDAQACKVLDSAGH